MSLRLKFFVYLNSIAQDSKIVDFLKIERKKREVFHNIFLLLQSFAAVTEADVVWQFGFV